MNRTLTESTRSMLSHAGDRVGAVYIKGAALDDSSIHGSKHVITITPPVPRRAGWSNDETSVFYVRFGSSEQATEVSSVHTLVQILLH